MAWEAEVGAAQSRSPCGAESETPERNNIIVDVGAGSLQTREGRAFFLGHGSSAIAVDRAVRSSARAPQRPRSPGVSADGVLA